MSKIFIYFIFHFCFLYPLSAKTIFVGSKLNITSIAKALIDSNPYDTILVQSGHYFEKNIQILKPVVLLGIGKPILDGQHTFEVISVRASNVTISGFIIQNSGVSSIVDYAGIKVYNSNFVNIVGNSILNCFFGIYLQYASSCRLSNNFIRANGLSEQESANGIHCWYSNHLLINSNSISGHRDGIYFEFVTNTVVKKNASKNNIRYGLHFMFSNNDEYSENIFDNNGSGVAVMFSHHVKMIGNTFENNWGDASYGILIKEITDSKVIKNTFSHNTSGLYIDGASRIKMSNNVFLKNGWGLKIQANCIDIKVNKNNFIGNTFDVATNGSLVLNDFSSNYWDKYEGYDLDKNKVGDIPYRPLSLFSLLIERNPSSMIMFRSIISLLMDRAERFIPSLTPELLKDESPSMRPILL